MKERNARNAFTFQVRKHSGNEAFFGMMQFSILRLHLSVFGSCQIDQIQILFHFDSWRSKRWTLSLFIKGMFKCSDSWNLECMNFKVSEAFVEPFGTRAAHLKKSSRQFYSSGFPSNGMGNAHSVRRNVQWALPILLHWSVADPMLHAQKQIGADAEGGWHRHRLMHIAGCSLGRETSTGKIGKFYCESLLAGCASTLPPLFLTPRLTFISFPFNNVIGSERRVQYAEWFHRPCRSSGWLHANRPEGH